MFGFLRKLRWFAMGIFVMFAIISAVRYFRGPEVANNSYLVVDIEGEYSEGRPPSPLSRLVDDSHVLIETLSALETARADDRIKGVIARVRSTSLGWGQARELRDAIESFASADKEIITYLSADVIGGNLEYYLASVGDRVYLEAAGTPLLNGLSINYLFLGGLWEKFDVDVEVEQIREYKSFGDTLARRRMSAPHREMANSILDSVNDEFVGTIAESRGFTRVEVASLIDECPTSAADFVAVGLADRVVPFDILLEELGDGKKVATVDGNEYARIASRPNFRGGPQIAVIHAVGSIMSGDGGGVTGQSAGSDTLSKAFDEASEDKDVKAIVFRIDSPGGSAAASDQVWRKVKIAAQKKPVIASLGNVAASGGYYMASAADEIFTEPATLTGSIGVVLFKPNIAGLLGRMGIGTETLGRGRYSRLMDTTKGLDRAEATLLRNQMEGVYDLFLKRVSTGRDLSKEDVDAIGGGRVWTGNQAVDNGLADHIGGILDAVHRAADRANIDPIQSKIVFYPKRESLMDELSAIRLGQAASPLPSVLENAREAVWSAANLRPGIYTLAAGFFRIY